MLKASNSTQLIPDCLLHTCVLSLTLFLERSSQIYLGGIFPPHRSYPPGIVPLVECSTSRINYIYEFLSCGLCAGSVQYNKHILCERQVGGPQNFVAPHYLSHFTDILEREIFKIRTLSTLLLCPWHSTVTAQSTTAAHTTGDPSSFQNALFVSRQQSPRSVSPSVSIWHRAWRSG